MTYLHVRVPLIAFELMDGFSWNFIWTSSH